MEGAITWVGIDAHKKTLAVAVLSPGAKPEEFTVDNTETALKKLARRLQRTSRGREVRACYEASRLSRSSVACRRWTSSLHKPPSFPSTASTLRGSAAFAASTRHRALRIPSQARRVPGPRTIALLERRIREARWDHEDRKRTHSSSADPSCLAVPASRRCRAQAPHAPSRATRSGRDDRRRGATSAVGPLPTSCGPRKKPTKSRRRGRARARRFPPGQRFVTTARSRVTALAARHGLKRRAAPRSGQRRKARKEKRAS